jgi:hypothetical protein
LSLVYLLFRGKRREERGDTLERRDFGEEK